MSSRTFQLSDELHGYVLSVSVQETDVQRRLREETATLKNAGMQISPEQGQFMRLLIELSGAKTALEIGTFTGYSALCVAMALPADGRLICCDVNEAWTAIARRYWGQAGVAGKIELRLGPALETLARLERGGGASVAATGRGTAVGAVRTVQAFDFVFIDADKPNYDAYYEYALRLLRPGGLIAVDNALWSGRVADSTVDDPDTAALRALNLKVGRDARVSASLVPIGDGLLLARKR